MQQACWDFRNTTKLAIQNQQVLDWWEYRFDRKDLNERTRREWIEPVLNKIDALSLDPVIRNIIGQPRCTLDFEEIIKRKQILVVNLNQNKIGYDNAAFIGMLIIARIRQAAAKVGKREEPFALTIDEAHSFPTMELTTIINQGRHHGLFARISHQNLDQFDWKISNAIRNGCGSLAVFAVGNKDAERMVDDLSGNNQERTLDLIRHLGRGECYMRLTENGTPSPPPTYPVQIKRRDTGQFNLDGVIQFTRERFATPKLDAEFQIAFAHDQFTKQDYLTWKSKFRTARKERSRIHNQQREAKAARKSNHLKTAFGGAAKTLQEVGNQLFKERSVNPQSP